MILSTEELRAIESRAFNDGVTAESLMNPAGLSVARTVIQFFPTPGTCHVYYGKGNNGGDALVASRHLANAGWRIKLISKFCDHQLAALPGMKLREAKAFVPAESDGISGQKRPFVIIDGLLGTGAKGELRDPVKQAAREINESRRKHNAYVFSIDVPSGLDSNTGNPAEDTVIADFTIAVGFARSGHVSDNATGHVGRLTLAPLKALKPYETSGPASSVLTSPASLPCLFPRRNFDSHKTNFGRIGIVAGSRGLTGAPVMSALGAVRAGGGLVTLYVREPIYSIVASLAPPEVMVRAVGDYREVLQEKHDALAIGPGLGSDHEAETVALVQNARCPLVVDADGLNAIAKRIDILKACSGPRLLTPHPGEMSRLQNPAGRRRREWVGDFVEEYPVTLLLKGARTLVGEKNQPLCYNTTGSPGMGTGGMGDILTGVCVALLGQGLSPFDSARLGAWVCGRAAEIAIFSGGRSEESLIATDLLDQLGEAFQDFRNGCY
jgi:hydroxyethylthiazole kinase-like uncharacterized protein yjeF